jgi:hypothetical protein
VSEFDNGRDDVRIDRFGVFFLRNKVDENGNGGTIEAEYVGERIALGNSHYSPGKGPGIPELAQPVLYR